MPQAAQDPVFIRSARMLRTAMGPQIAAWLDDPSVVEIMLNPDGRLWTDRLAGGLAPSEVRLSPADGERIVRLVAHHVGAAAHAGAPRVSAELPQTGERRVALASASANASACGRLAASRNMSLV